MSKAEEMAMEHCCAKCVHNKLNCGMKLLSNGRDCIKCGNYIKGYHQAEKDLELTWEDIKIILDKEDDILSECNSHKELVIETYPKGEDYYGEILKRFKDSKKCQIGNTE